MCYGLDITYFLHFFKNVQISFFDPRQKFWIRFVNLREFFQNVIINLDIITALLHYLCQSPRIDI
jgi:hypothetical protein